MKSKRISEVLARSLKCCNPRIDLDLSIIPDIDYFSLLDEEIERSLDTGLVLHHQTHIGKCEVNGIKIV